MLTTKQQQFPISSEAHTNPLEQLSWIWAQINISHQNQVNENIKYKKELKSKHTSQMGGE